MKLNINKWHGPVMEKWPDKEVDAKEKEPGSRRTYTVLYLFVFLSFE